MHGAIIKINTFILKHVEFCVSERRNYSCQCEELRSGLPGLPSTTYLDINPSVLKQNP
jgi:hypothetical protein